MNPTKGFSISSEAAGQDGISEAGENLYIPNPLNFNHPRAHRQLHKSVSHTGVSMS